MGGCTGEKRERNYDTTQTGKKRSIKEKRKANNYKARNGKMRISEGEMKEERK